MMNGQRHQRKRCLEDVVDEDCVSNDTRRLMDPIVKVERQNIELILDGACVKTLMEVLLEE